MKIEKLRTLSEIEAEINQKEDLIAAIEEEIFALESEHTITTLANNPSMDTVLGQIITLTPPKGLKWEKRWDRHYKKRLLAKTTNQGSSCQVDAEIQTHPDWNQRHAGKLQASVTIRIYPEYNDLNIVPETTIIKSVKTVNNLNAGKLAIDEVLKKTQFKLRQKLWD